VTRRREGPGRARERRRRGRSTTGETGEGTVGGPVGALVCGSARWEEEVGLAQLRFQIEFCQI
jgi:hypothetical protein